MTEPPTSNSSPVKIIIYLLLGFALATTVYSAQKVSSKPILEKAKITPNIIIPTPESEVLETDDLASDSGIVIISTESATNSASPSSLTKK